MGSGRDAEIPPPALKEAATARSPRVPSEPSFAGHASSEVFLSWKDVKYRVDDRDTGGEKEILRGVSGYVGPGEILAILGPSGAGKSSLLDVLAGRIQEGISGTIEVNGTALSRRVFQRISGYVHQNGTFFESLTVRETLTYAALLQLPKDMPFEKKEKRVQRVLRQLDLEKCAGTYVGGPSLKGISGGESRRLAVGTQLINDPRLLFLDEPTSGLDATSAFRLVKLLKRLAREQRHTIVCVIHQPRASILQLFTRVMLIADGRAAYLGPPASIVSYFAEHGFECPSLENPADYLLDLVNSRGDEEEGSDSEDDSDPEKIPTKRPSRQESVRRVIELYDKSDMAHDAVHPPSAFTSLPALREGSGDLSRRYPTPWFFQMWILLRRSFFYKLRTPAAVMTQASTTIIIGLIVGSIYYGIDLNQITLRDRLAAVSFTTIMSAFLFYDVILLFPIERQIYRVEHESGMYSTSAYFIARNLAEMPFHIAFVWSMASIIYWMAGFQSDAGKFFIFSATQILTGLTGVSVLLLISSISPSMDAANVLASVLLVILMLFDGFWVQNIPSFYKWMENLSFMRYGVQASAKNEYDGLEFTCEGAESGACIRNGTDALSSFAMGNVDITDNLLRLMGYILGYRLLSYFAFRFLYSGTPVRVRFRRWKSSVFGGSNAQSSASDHHDAL